MKMIFKEIYNNINDYFNHKDEAEIYFFRYIWNILEDYGLTSYKNDYDKLIILIRACVIINLYNNFCMRYYGTPINENYLKYLIEYCDDYKVNFNLQLLGDKHYIELNDECINILIEKYKNEVYKVICRELLIINIYKYMAIAGSYKNQVYHGDNYTFIDSYDDYVKSIDFPFQIIFYSKDAYIFLSKELLNENLTIE